MPPTSTRRNRDELARLGEDVYSHHIRPLLGSADDGKFVAIDVVTGEYEIDASDYTAVMNLHTRVPGAEVWLVRVGHATAHKL